MFNFRYNKSYFILLTSYLIHSSCSIQKQIARSAKEEVLSNKAFQTAHVGISIFEPAENKYLYNYQGDKYFVPASNTKLPTCYAAMKYLGDSLVGLYLVDFKYKDIGAKNWKDSIWLIQPAGDPTFLHPDFKNQPVYELLKSLNRPISLVAPNWFEQGLGSGWAWGDYQENYMAERSAMPIYGNVARFRLNKDVFTATPKYFLYQDDSILADYINDRLPKTDFTIRRELNKNNFYFTESRQKFQSVEIPFVPTDSIVERLLSDTIGKKISFGKIFDANFAKGGHNAIHSQPTDSLLKPMMHRSDNFFAEQSLLMVSNEMLGVMNDEKIIDTLLKTDFKDLPQKPRWADGSGLSRYNLFTPQDFVAILNKMKNEFGMERIKVIFPTGGEGTISSYYKADSGYIYGKTGTLSGVVAFSGYFYTKKGKLLIFSTLVNNHQGSTTDIRRAVERFLQGVRSKF
ncbi:MAG: hypothetical protein FJY20_01225 [Bacteroidetes bacterium]|nr:hypothetical protein [Bacteroidota bacterium]